jgi:UDP-N-acetylglucosamine acyltransferase
MAIHARCDIHPSAVLADNVEIASGVCVGPDAIIGAGVEIGPNAVIGPNTIIGAGVRIYPGAIIGSDPQDMKYDGATTRCIIGARTTIREYTTISRGTKASGETVIGSDSFIMSYVHIAHDCRIGNHVVMTNNAALAGHCEVEDNAILGGYSSYHQFVRVGTLAMIAGFSGLRQDAPPYMVTYGYPPAKVYGLNSIGLRRAGKSAETRSQLKDAFRILYRSGLNFSDALETLRNGSYTAPEIQHLIEFFESSKRGISRGSVSGKMGEIDPDFSDDSEENESVPSKEIAREIKR